MKFTRRQHLSILAVQLAIVVACFAIWQWGWSLRAYLGNWVPTVLNPYFIARPSLIWHRFLVLGCFTDDDGGWHSARAFASCVFSDDGRCVGDARVMRRALEYVRAFGGVISQHSQDPHLAGPAACFHEGEISGRLGLPGWPGVAEEVIVARDVMLARHTGSRVHVAHVSTAGSVEVIRWAKAQAELDGHWSVTAEVTPHHLMLDTTRLSDYDPTFKVNPPLRPTEDIAELRKALADGTIDAVATDHAPHARHDKEHAFAEAAFGMLGLEEALQVVNTVMVQPGLMSWAQVAEVMSVTPARIAGLSEHGRPLAAGEPATITLVDPTATVEIDRADSRSLSRNNPWHQMILTGRVQTTFLRGRPTLLDQEEAPQISPLLRPTPRSSPLLRRSDTSRGPQARRSDTLRGPQK